MAGREFGNGFRISVLTFGAEVSTYPGFGFRGFLGYLGSITVARGGDGLRVAVAARTGVSKDARLGTGRCRSHRRGIAMLVGGGQLGDRLRVGVIALGAGIGTYALFRFRRLFCYRRGIMMPKGGNVRAFHSAA